MGGGLMQLVAYGAQDVYLTGNPQITFFKVVYRRHTNFSMEAIQQTFNGSADFGKKVTCTISRNGDLINRVYLQVDLPDVEVRGTLSSAPSTGTNVATGKVAFRWLNWLGHILIKNVEIEIGGQKIDKHYGEWLHIWNELTQTAGHQLGYANMVGNTPGLTNVTVSATSGDPLTVKGQTLFIPLQFWFCRNAGLALPLIALQYHEVRINLELRDAVDCYWAAEEYTADASNSAAVKTWTEKPSLVSVPQGRLNASLYVDYVYLDTDERRRFAQVPHEYLIEQLQFTGDESTSNTNNKVKLNFNHPTKELIWVTQPDVFTESGMPGGKQWFNWTDAADPTYGTYAPMATASSAWSSGAPLANPDGTSTNAAGTMPGVAAGGASLVHIPVSFEAGDNPTAIAKLLLNGHDRFSERPGRYFNLVQPFQHHENVPSCGINVYSFGLKPEEHQPSGTCNMSRIDNATLQLTLTNRTVHNRTAKVKVFAVSYNVLRIQSGMGGLAYSN